MIYQTRYGDTPASIAGRFGISVERLLAANPQKPTMTVSGSQTWQSLSVGETVNVPYYGYGSQTSYQRAWPAAQYGGAWTQSHFQFPGERRGFVRERGFEPRGFPRGFMRGADSGMGQGGGGVPMPSPPVAPPPAPPPDASTPAAAPAPAPTTDPTLAKHHGMSTGVKVAIGVGVVGALGTGIYFATRKGKRKRR